jgi:hypothetical protein
MENLTTFAYWLGHGGPTGKEIHVRMEKKYWFRSPLRIHMISVSWIRIPNADSRCGCGSRLSYVKFSDEILITNTMINIM